MIFSSKLDLKFKLFYTLPSSNAPAGFSNDSEKYMYNGSYSPSTISSVGSYYSARVANTIERGVAFISAGSGYTSSVCPKQWRLATYAEYTAFRTSSYASSWNVVHSGYYYMNAAHGSGEGYWWSSTYMGNSNFYYLGARSGSLSEAVNGWARDGLSLRCKNF